MPGEEACLGLSKEGEDLGPAASSLGGAHPTMRSPGVRCSRPCSSLAPTAAPVLSIMAASPVLVLECTPCPPSSWLQSAWYPSGASQARLPTASQASLLPDRHQRAAVSIGQPSTWMLDVRSIFIIKALCSGPSHKLVLP